MHIAVIGDEIAQKEFQDKQIPQGVQVYFKNSVEDIDTAVDALFYLNNEDDLKNDIHSLKRVETIVFVHAVVTTLKELPPHCVRINAWRGFLLNKQIELSASTENLAKADKILKGLQWQYLYVPDVEGMIAPRTIAMIINEAYFALEEKVSTREQIDIAMKLGTNYPYGPFEWSKKIGLENISKLLQQLAHTDKRYTPASLLINELND